MIRFSSNTFAVEAAGPDGQDRRTITGVAVPYNTFATVSDGTNVQFAPGSLSVEGKAPKLYMYHDSTQAVGLVAERVDSPEAMYFTARVSNTRAGDEALVLASDGVIDAVSVGVNPTEFKYDDAGNMTIIKGDWVELSLVPQGAFAGATITQVAAEAPQVEEQKEEPKMELSPIVSEEVIVPTAPIFAQPKREFAMPSASEMLAAYHTGGDTWHKVNDAFVQASKRNQTAIQAAAGDILTSDTPGLLSVSVLGPVFQDLNYVRPVVNAFGARAMPNTPSRQFIRPTITTHTSAAVQSAQLDAVSATTMVIASNTVTKSTVAGQVTLSRQDIDFTDPAAMQVVLNDLAGQVLIKTDDIAADALVSGATASGSTWTVTAADPSGLFTALYDAAREIAEDSNFFPTHLCVSPDVWEKLGRQTDADKRPVFGYNANGMMTTNSIGNVSGIQYTSMNVLGLNVVVDNNFASGTMLVVYAPGFEIYESGPQLLSLDNPSTLGKNLSIHQYFATFVAKSSFIQSITIA
jgi:phage head maturation protease